MKLHQLQVFVAVVQEKSLRSASRRLNLTQPAVTRSIQELEADVDASLLERSVKGVELTTYGAAFYVRANQLLTDARRAQDELDQLKGEMCGKVSVGVTSTIALTFLPNAVKRFLHKAPTAELALMDLRFPQAFRQLRDGSVDFAASHLPSDTLDNDLQSIHLLSTDFVVMVRKGHPLAHARSLAELVDAQWLHPLSSPADRTSIMGTAFAKQQLAMPKKFIRCASFAVALAMIADTDTIGLFSRPLALRFAQYGLEHLVLDTPLAPLEIGVVMRKDIRLTPAAQYFLECLKDGARALDQALPQRKSSP